MKYRFFFFLIILASCSSVSVNKYEKPVFNSKGFAYIYNASDYEEKLLTRRLDKNSLQIAHSQLRPGVYIKIIIFVVEYRFS